MVPKMFEPLKFDCNRTCAALRMLTHKVLIRTIADGILEDCFCFQRKIWLGISGVLSAKNSEIFLSIFQRESGLTFDVNHLPSRSIHL